MAGEIHGIISREDAWRMWEPYGERFEGVETVDPETLTATEVRAILYGAPHDERTGDIYHYVEPRLGDDEDWIEGTVRIFEEGIATALPDMLAQNYTFQAADIAPMRKLTTEREAGYVRRYDSAIPSLVEAGYLTGPQAREASDRLYGPDYTPFMQYTPMTPLEYVRYITHLDGEEPTYGKNGRCGAFTDFGTGILGTVEYNTAAHVDSHAKAVKNLNRPHELAHAWQGVELVSAIYDDGTQRPVPVVVGHSLEELTTGPVGPIGAGDAQYFALAEGYTQMQSEALVSRDESLGSRCPEDKSYASFLSVVGQIRTDSPDIYQTITEAAMVDATPDNPTAKRDALAAMDVLADEVFGGTQTLSRVFVSERARRQFL